MGWAKLKPKTVIGTELVRRGGLEQHAAPAGRMLFKDLDGMEWRSVARLSFVMASVWQVARSKQES